MNIKDFGGEFALINLIKRGIKLDKDVVLGIGDDCAVLKFDKKNYLLFTTDTIVDGDHFSLEWWKPEQIGMKAVEINSSDIYSMGGIPKHIIVALTLPDETSVEFVRDLYRGINKSCKKHKINLVGGNITHGKQLNIGIGLIGTVEKKRLCLRSCAKAGELICVTGYLGGGRAGLQLFLNRKEGKSKSHHLLPKANPGGRIISQYSRCMIDVSDGLASEVKHICEESNVGAVVYKEQIPIKKEVFSDAKKLGKDAYDFALHGGEDFQLVFTINENKINELRKRIKFSIVGEILPKKKGIFLIDKGKKYSLGSGYDHFKTRIKEKK
ncbi:thiamine-phosphate kinase [Candidatus Woesearchaeota archaeon]|nr:thiamine-phosphate kinase [Candidatus Woesearchaeota archaeon]